MKNKKKNLPILNFLHKKWKGNEVIMSANDWNKIMNSDINGSHHQSSVK